LAINKKGWGKYLVGSLICGLFLISHRITAEYLNPSQLFELTIFYVKEKRRFDQRTFNDEITAGTVLETINVALPGGFTSIFTLVLPETGITLKEISTSSSESSSVTELPPIVVVKMLVESLVPLTRVTGALPGVEKTISMVVRSTADAWAGKPMEKVIVSIPLYGSEDIP
jgi:hypothetical protein